MGLFERVGGIADVFFAEVQRNDYQNRDLLVLRRQEQGELADGLLWFRRGLTRTRFHLWLLGRRRAVGVVIVFESLLKEGGLEGVLVEAL